MSTDHGCPVSPSAGSLAVRSLAGLGSGLAVIVDGIALPPPSVPAPVRYGEP